MRAEEEMISWEKLEPVLVQIKETALNLEMEKIYNLISQIVPQFNPKSNGNDLEKDNTK